MPSPDQPDRVADLIDRLLADSGFRAEFRRDPVGVARRLELTGLAAELDLGGKALHTLEVRESRSSLAGVVMAAAAEGIGSADLARLAGDSGLDTEARAVVDRALSRPQLRVVPEGSDASPPTHEPGAAAPPPVEAPPETAGSAAARSLADDPRLGLPAEARALLTSGSVDPRLVDLLGSLVVRHELGVGALQPGAVEIVTVDGEHVSPRSLAARDLAGELTELTRGRATHVRTPWPIDAPGFAGDAPPDRIVLSLEGPSAGPTETMDDGGTGRGSAVFRAVSADDSRLAPRTIAFPVATQDEAPPDPGRVPLAEEAASPASEALDYPGDDAPREAVAAWMARRAEAAGLPAELPVMASLVESGLRNLAGGDRDSVGFFQMRTGIWDRGAYAGYTDDPELQLKWFIDHALAVKDKRVAGGDASFGSDPRSWGAWIADVERPAEQYRGRYQLRLGAARALLGQDS